MANLHSMLVEVSGTTWPGGRLEVPSTITALSSSCLIALAVARGEAELALGAVASLIMTNQALTDQDIQVKLKRYLEKKN